MVRKPFITDGLTELCSKDQLELLDSIDSLRSQGISHYVSLPQIIVCGDQSSGKSSVLEAISGISFPIKSNLCTRFPTELVLRKTSHSYVSVSIVPDQSRSESEKQALGNFRQELVGFDGLPTLIEEARDAMGIGNGRAFSKDLLRVEVSGPDRPHLTIVDLPGLVHSETKQQSASDVELVQSVVKAYMKEPRSIILAVVSAKNDYANQVVLKLARSADKQGNRTLGVITKPDTLSSGSASEAMYVALAKNEDVEFRLGWHVLRNLDSEKEEKSLTDRDSQEKEFFSKGVWEGLDRSLVGVDKLRKRLSELLVKQIATELPSLMSEIEAKSEDCRQSLEKLGKPRTTSYEQLFYLLHLSQLFQSLVKASVDGTYNDPFFGDAKTKKGYQKRIRAVVQNLNESFAEHITRDGHQRQIIDDSNLTDSTGGVTEITREDFLDHIENLMKSTRGRELPGSFNPMIVADLFREQSIPWEAITKSHIEKVWKATGVFINLMIRDIADAGTSKALWQKIFEPAMNQLLEVLKTKTAELLAPHKSSHPITYNRAFIDTLQKVRKDRSESEFAEIIKNFFGVQSLESVEFQNCRNCRYDSPGNFRDLRPLVAKLADRMQPGMARVSCIEALNCMEAYYKVALERFIDDVSVEVIETKLISQLREIFSPITVNLMKADLVKSIAGESEEIRTTREQLTRQLDILLKGSETCKRFINIGDQDADQDTVQASHLFKSNPSEVDSVDHISTAEDVASLPDEAPPVDEPEQDNWDGNGFDASEPIDEPVSEPEIEPTPEPVEDVEPEPVEEPMPEPLEEPASEEWGSTRHSKKKPKKKKASMSHEWFN